MISHLPSKVMKVLEIVGFSGNRQRRITELSASTLLADGLRCPLANLIMLSYQCYIEHIFGRRKKEKKVTCLKIISNDLGLGEGDMKMVARMLDFSLAKHPDVMKSI